MLSNIVLVPVYLSYWDASTYGLWLAVQALVIQVQTLDLGYQSHIGREFIKVYVNDRTRFETFLSSSLLYGKLVALLEATGFYAFYHFDLANRLLGGTGIDPLALDQAAIFLVVQSALYCLAGSSAALRGKAVIPLQYNPRMAWWNVLIAISGVIGSVLAIVIWGNILAVGLAFAGVTFVLNLLLIVDTQRILQRKGINPAKPDLALGFRELMRSTVIIAIAFIDSLRQQGIRLVISQWLDLSRLTQFATTRTIANLVMQGANSIFWPISPEQQKLIQERNVEKTTTLLWLMWAFSGGLLAPGLIGLQPFAEPLFLWWTHGKIQFDPILFVLFSITALVYASNRPAIQVITSFNYLKPQIVLSIFSVLILFASIGFLMQGYGIRGIASALLITEFFNLFAATCIASRLLKQHELIWPKRSLNFVSGYILITSACTLTVALDPVFTIYVLPITYIGLLMILVLMFRKLPQNAKMYFLSLSTRFGRSR